MARGQVKLRMYWDLECRKPLDQPMDEHERPIPVDLGEVSYVEGGHKSFDLYLRNEGDRTYYIININATNRPDLTIIFNAERRIIKPRQMIPLQVIWDMSKAQDDLRFDFGLEGKFYVFGD